MIIVRLMGGPGDQVMDRISSSNSVGLHIRRALYGRQATKRKAALNLVDFCVSSTIKTRFKANKTNETQRSSLLDANDLTCRLKSAKDY